MNLFRDLYITVLVEGGAGRQRQITSFEIQVQFWSECRDLCLCISVYLCIFLCVLSPQIVTLSWRSLKQRYNNGLCCYFSSTLAYNLCFFNWKYRDFVKIDFHLSLKLSSTLPKPYRDKLFNIRFNNWEKFAKFSYKCKRRIKTSCFIIKTLERRGIIFLTAYFTLQSFDISINFISYPKFALDTHYIF